MLRFCLYALKLWSLNGGYYSHSVTVYKFTLKIILCYSQQTFFENNPVEKTKKDPKRLSVERIYQKKTQLEHILLRPDSYIGSVEPVTQVRSHTAMPESLKCMIPLTKLY